MSTKAGTMEVCDEVKELLASEGITTPEEEKKEEVVEKDIEAKLENGVLTLNVKKQEEKKPEKVEDVFARVTKLEDEISISLKALLGDN